jgi:exonuclease V gamma subunit
MTITIGPIGQTPDERFEQSRELLSGLVELYNEGHRTPIPMPCEAAYGWQRNVDLGRGKAWKAARDAWEDDRFNPESADPAHDMLFPDLKSTNALLAAGFEEYAERLWAPILPRCSEETI